jgi:mannan endo-1,4-beta-mannosidase
MTFTRIRGRRAVVAAAIAVVAMLGALWSPSAATATTSSSATTRTHSGSADTPASSKNSGDFVTRHGSKLELGGKPFEFAGTNNYYLGYKSSTMADRVLDDAQAARFDVMRTWGFQDFQNPDGSDSVQSSFEGVWYQAWDAAAGHPMINGGANGLQKLDHVIAAAGARNIKLIIPFVNNWNGFGGMDQYVRWAGGSTHAQFYTDPKIQGWFKTYISTLLNRTNSITGVKYKDDPTIMSWELANEPRCTSAGVYPDGKCDTTTITNWASTMSTFIKTIDTHHLLAVGDEGAFCRAPADWTLTQKYGASGYGPGLGEDCKDGIDTIALTALPNIDMMSMHLYPDNWKESVAWGDGWIAEHAAAAKKLGKPVYLGEFGLLDKSIRLPVFAHWLETVRSTGVAGALYWILSSKQDDGTLYGDYDGFTVYCPSPVCSLMTTQAALVPKPDNPTIRQTIIADNDTATTQVDTPVTVDVLANDISIKLAIRRASLDLDPATPGRQMSVVTPGGVATIASDGRVQFVPTGKLGTFSVPYAVSNGKLTSTAALTVTVKPVPGAPVVLESWENGLNGWAPANWQTAPGSVAVTTNGATDGAQALQISALGSGAWFGSGSFTPLLDLSTRSAVSFSLKTGAAGSSVALAVRSGDAYTWCQSPFLYVAPNTTETHSIDLSTMGCAQSTLTGVHDLFLFFNAGTFDIDQLTVK